MQAQLGEQNRRPPPGSQVKLVAVSSHFGVTGFGPLPWNNSPGVLLVVAGWGYFVDSSLGRDRDMLR